MKDLKRQDRNGSRTATDIERKYKLGQIDYTAEEIEKLKLKLVVDSSLSASSPNAIANSAVTQALNTKVNKETGKGLSTNDYTDKDKEKLEKAEENVIESISVNGVKQEIKDKNVDIKTSPNGAIETKVVLYEDSTGTTGAVTLSETAANFSYLEIFYGDIGNKINNPNGKTKGLLACDSGSTTTYFYSTRITISGTSITQENGRRVAISSEGLTAFDTTNVQPITKVVGYREAE